MTSRKAVFAGTWLAAAALVLSGCAGSGGGAEPASSSGSDKTDVAYLAFALASYTQAEIDGLESVGLKVQPFISNFDDQKQLQQCADAISSDRFAALVLVITNPSTGVVCAQKAHEAGIPVFVIDTSIKADPLDTTLPENVAGQVLLFNQTKAAIAAKLVKEACGDVTPCNVIATQPDEASPSSAVVNDAISKVPGVKIVAEFVTHYDPSLVVQTLPDLLTAHPDTNVISMTDDDTAAAAAKLLKSKGFDIQVLGVGASEGGVAAMKAGDVYGTAVELPFTYGQTIGEMVKTIVGGGEIAEPSVDAFSLGDLTEISQSNLSDPAVADFEAQW